MGKPINEEDFSSTVNGISRWDKYKYKYKQLIKRSVNRNIFFANIHG